MRGVARVSADAAGGTQLGGGQDYVRIDGVPICVAGDAASCGHTTTGSDWVTVTP